MLFSIIVPAYNVGKCLEECLQSIISQIREIHEECEIILIDDGSTDSTVNLCDIYEKKYPKMIRVFHNINHGLLLTRRFGYKKALGDYIINCDSDDCLEMHTLKELRNTIFKYKEPDVILFNHYLLYSDGKKKEAYKNIFTDEQDCFVNKNTVLKEFLLRHSVVSVCCKIYKRACIDAEKDYSNFKQVSNGEDTLQSIEFFNNAETFVYLNKALYDYRIGLGMTRKYDPNYFFSFKIVLEEIYKQKDIWNLLNYDELFAVKVLQTAGRAITQSRYNLWKTVSEHKDYLICIREDDMFNTYINFLPKIQKELQKNHSELLKLLKYRMYIPIIVFLNIKNISNKKYGANYDKIK